MANRQEPVKDVLVVPVECCPHHLAVIRLHLHQLETFGLVHLFHRRINQPLAEPQNGAILKRRGKVFFVQIYLEHTDDRYFLILGLHKAHQQLPLAPPIPIGCNSRHSTFLNSFFSFLSFCIVWFGCLKVIASVSTVVWMFL